jgi:hypothetical protein
MVGVLLGHCTVTTCVSYNSHTTTTKHAAAALTMTQQPHHDKLFLAAFSATHANCHASIDRAQSALLANAWQLARVGQNGRQKTFARAAMGGCWVPPLSLVQNIKKLFH